MHEAPLKIGPSPRLRRLDHGELVAAVDEARKLGGGEPR
jgi:hypothetical protein